MQRGAIVCARCCSSSLLLLFCHSFAGRSQRGARFFAASGDATADERAAVERRLRQVDARRVLCAVCGAARRDA